MLQITAPFFSSQCTLQPEHREVARSLCAGTVPKNTHPRNIGEKSVQPCASGTVFKTKAVGISQAAQKGSFSSCFLLCPWEQELAARKEETV